MKSKERAVVLVSGGMDSCLTAAIACQSCDAAFMHINYGQRTEKRELKAFEDIADYYGIANRLVIDLSFFKQIGGSSLTDRRMAVTSFDQASHEIPSSYVPFRNAALLAAATGWAEVLGARKIFIGAVEEDSSGYPDCRDIFFKKFEQAIKAGTRPETRIKIVRPIIHLRKSAIVCESQRLQAPLHLTWSCYQEETVACGVCDSCRLRLKGFKLAGQTDPIPYL